MRFIHRQLAAAALAIASLVLVAGSPAAAQTLSNVFLKIDGIEGESVHEGHEGEIDIDSWSLGAGAGTGGKPTFQDLHFSKHVDKASPKLLESVANGKHYKSAVLTAEKPGDRPHQYLTITLEDVLISSFFTNQDSSDLPTESVTINFAKITYIYTPQRVDGTADVPIRTCWDIKANRAC